MSLGTSNKFFHISTRKAAFKHICKMIPWGDINTSPSKYNFIFLYIGQVTITFQNKISHVVYKLLATRSNAKTYT